MEMQCQGRLAQRKEAVGHRNTAQLSECRHFASAKQVRNNHGRPELTVFMSLLAHIVGRHLLVHACAQMRCHLSHI